MARLSKWVAPMLVAGLLMGSCGELANGDGTGTADGTRTIAILRAAPSSVGLETGFFSELRTAGWVEGHNLTVLARQREEAYPDPDDASDAVERWLEQGAELFVAFSSTGAFVVMETAPDAPVLFLSNDPSAIGLVENEQRPEGNATGVTYRVPADRTLELATRAIPDLDAIGILYQRGDATSGVHRSAIEQAAAELGIEFVSAGWENADDVPQAIAELAELGAGGLVMSNSPGIVAMLDQIEASVRAHRLPVIANVSIVPWALVAVFPNPEELGRQAARQTARILSGSSPSAVPVEDPRGFEVVINLVIAEELDIEVPSDVLREATEVISP